MGARSRRRSRRTSSSTASTSAASSCSPTAARPWTRRSCSHPSSASCPPDDPRIRATVLAIRDELSVDGLVLRYRVEETDDGFSGEEGTFTICSFWLVSALCEIGEFERARALCAKLLSLRRAARAVRGGDRPAQWPAPGQLPPGVHPPRPHQRGPARHPDRGRACGRGAGRWSRTGGRLRSLRAPADRLSGRAAPRRALGARRRPAPGRGRGRRAPGRTRCRRASGRRRPAPRPPGPRRRSSWPSRSR